MRDFSEPPPVDAGPVAVVAGAGVFPIKVVEAVRRTGRDVFVVALAGIADARIEAFPHIRLSLGEVGRFFSEIERRGAREIVLVGPVVRPDFSSLRFDFGALRHLPDIVALSRGGDDGVLGTVIRFIESRGLVVRGAHEVAPDLLVPEGRLTRAAPGRDDLADIEVGRAALAEMGRLDIGQALVVQAGRVVAVEAAEGTDAMLDRVAEMRRAGRLRVTGRAGIMVKTPKPGQDLRVDMPAIGEETVRRAAAAGLSGIAVEAGRVIAPDRDLLRAAAERAGLFVLGMKPAAP